MTNKAYIVANEQQEREVLKKLEEKGALWGNGEKAVNFIPFRTFPYVIYCNGDKFISWDKLYDLDVDKIIVFDGRKEEQMSDKYVVSQGFMNELNLWCDVRRLHDFRLLISDLNSLPDLIKNWQKDELQSDEEYNNRLIAIIRWVNGEDVFEVEKPKKWVVRSIGLTDDDERYYVSIGKFMGLKRAISTYTISQATRFDTKEEAESWANAHQEVVEVEE